jgi:plastocyanin domain-containing protein
MKQSVITILLLGVVIGFVVYKVSDSNDPSQANTQKTQNTQNVQNVSVVDGKQVVEITARGGYTPRKTTAKAGIPTVLRVDTNGSYDCSIALRIPKLNIAKNLEPTATTDIDLGTPKTGKMNGICGMGMYSFEIDFQA